jgi:type IV secretory pathway component VirB8
MAKHVEKKEEEKKDTHKEVQSAPKENAVQLKKSTVLAVSVAIIMLIIGFAAGYLVSGALNTGASAGLD